jgi:hypothetical protein
MKKPPNTAMDPTAGVYPISVNQGELVELSLAKHRQGAD